VRDEKQAARAIAVNDQPVAWRVRSFSALLPCEFPAAAQPYQVGSTLTTRIGEVKASAVFQVFFAVARQTLVPLGSTASYN
jgi:hypothetical protein